MKNFKVFLLAMGIMMVSQNVAYGGQSYLKESFTEGHFSPEKKKSINDLVDDYLPKHKKFGWLKVPALTAPANIITKSTIQTVFSTIAKTNPALGLLTDVKDFPNKPMFKVGISDENIGKQFAETNKAVNNNTKKVESIQKDVEKNKNKIVSNEKLIKENEKKIEDVKTLANTNKDKLVSHEQIQKKLDKKIEDSSENIKGTLARESVKRANDKIMLEKKIDENKDYLKKELERRTNKDVEHDSKIAKAEKNIEDVKGLANANKDKLAKHEEIQKKLDKKIEDSSENIKGTLARESVKRANDKIMLEKKIDENKDYLKKELERRTNKDVEHDGKIAKVEKNVEANTSRIASLNEKLELNNKYLNERIDKLDKKVNRGISLMTAMSNVDFSSLEVGEMGIGAGVGKYSNSGAVAVGIAYKPTENLIINSKVAAIPGSRKNTTIGGGFMYKFVPSFGR